MSLQENTVPKTGTSIGMTWAEGSQNGGSVVIDYRVSYDQGAGDGRIVVLAANLISLSYVATGLTPGVTYTFKV
jgi:hypothetical protein